MYVYYKKVESENHYLYQKEIEQFFINMIVCWYQYFLETYREEYSLEFTDANKKNISKFIKDLIKDDNNNLYYMNKYKSFKKVYDLEKYRVQIIKAIVPQMFHYFMYKKSQSDFFTITCENRGDINEEV